MGVYQVEIPLKLPSCNEYINACRKNIYAGARMKKEIQGQIQWYLLRLPKITNPVHIHFHWVEANKKRDLDNCSFGKKFILDAMQEMGAIPNDNSKYITGFTDTFEYGKEAKVILTIEERTQDNDTN